MRERYSVGAGRRPRQDQPIPRWSTQRRRHASAMRSIAKLLWSLISFLPTNSKRHRYNFSTIFNCLPDVVSVNDQLVQQHPPRCLSLSVGGGGGAISERRAVDDVCTTTSDTEHCIINSKTKARQTKAAGGRRASHH